MNFCPTARSLPLILLERLMDCAVPNPRVYMIDWQGVDYGGAQKYSDELCIALGNVGFQVCLSRNIQPHASECSLRVQAPNQSIVALPPNVQLTESIGKTLKEFRPDILHVNSAAGAIRRALIELDSRGYLPGERIFTMHGSLITREIELRHKIKRYLPLTWMWRNHRHKNRFLQLFDQVICVSERQAAAMKKAFDTADSKVIAIPNGVDMNQHVPLGDQQSSGQDPVVIGTVARLTQIKRHDLLIRAFDLVAKHHNAKLLIAGDGPEKENICQLIEELKLQNSVHLSGYQENVIDFLRSIDIFALSSDGEGLPYAQLEAMAIGLPSVTTDVGDLPIVVRDQRDGFVVPRRNIKAFAEKLSVLVGDKSLRNKMGREARLRVCDSYSKTKALDETIGIFQTVHGELIKSA